MCLCAFVDCVLKHSNRANHFDEFMKWLNDHGVDTNSLSIGEFEEGFGLRADKDIEVCKIVFRSR